jgi:hypothetical protein
MTRSWTDSCPRCGGLWDYMGQRLEEFEAFGERKHLLVLSCSECEFKVSGCGPIHSMEPRRRVESGIEWAYRWLDTHRGATREQFDAWVKRGAPITEAREAP